MKTLMKEPDYYLDQLIRHLLEQLVYYYEPASARKIVDEIKSDLNLNIRKQSK